MAVVSFLVIGATLALSVWTLWATLRPEMARIVDLLINGPILIPSLPVPVSARSNLRNVRVCAIRLSTSQRAVA